MTDVTITTANGDQGGAAASDAVIDNATGTVVPPAGAELTTEQKLDAEFSGPAEPATSETDAGAPKEGGENGPETEGDKGKPVQERINEITAARREAERAAEEAKRDAEYWRGQAEALKPKTEGDGAETETSDGRPKPEDYEYGEADPKFTEDLARFAARSEYETQTAQAEYRASIADMEAGWNGRIVEQKVHEKYPDFDDVVVKGANEGKWDCSPLMALALKVSDFGPDIAHHLASNPAESTRIAGLSNIEQAREFGVMEGERRARATIAAEAAPKEFRTTAAPTPPEGRARGAGGKFATEADTDDFSAFESMADSVLKK